MASLLSTWCCPSCHGRLGEVADAVRLRCTMCDARYDVVGGIPDLRRDAPAWIDLDEDRDSALRLEREMRGKPLETMVRRVFEQQDGRTPADVETRTRQVLEAPVRLHPQLAGWLRAATCAPGFVDLGCGPGMVLAAAADQGVAGTGIDVSLVWLTVAKRMIEEHGGRANLAAAFSEALPLPDDTAPSIVSLDVIEHVGDQRRYLEEIDRVLAPRGVVALSTPNRFSLAAEPHVGVWGVGWLPQRLQQRYVRSRTGKSYEFVHLLSAPGLAMLLRRHTHIDGHFIVPRIDDDEIAHFDQRRVALADVYNRVAESPLMRWPLLGVGPFFRLVGTKDAGGGRRMPQSPATTEFEIPAVRTRDAQERGAR